MKTKKIQILGIRGLPAAHGGFETFAEHLSLYLIQAGWEVIVYCQSEDVKKVEYSTWNDVKLVKIPAKAGAFGSLFFDLKAHLLAIRNYRDFTPLVLGYNTAIISSMFNLFLKKWLINMDGIEWQRAKWSGLIKLWFWINEKIALLFATEFIADHPEIKKHLESSFIQKIRRKKIHTIPYGAKIVEDQNTDINKLKELALTTNNFFLCIARLEPENSIKEIINGWILSESRLPFLLIGPYSDDNAYHKEILNLKKSSQGLLIMPGAIYDQVFTKTLRKFCLAYFHGHQVGGTNPTLLESMAAGSLIIAHNNCYNKWVLDSNGYFFQNEFEVAASIKKVLESSHQENETLQNLNLERVRRNFSWNLVLSTYENLLKDFTA
jgi:glycosyltransferase involved in cell wall biosynthesis